jgi:hypothetical protein
VQRNHLIAVGSIVAIVIAVCAASTASAARTPDFLAYASCGAGKPSTAEHRCHYEGDHPRANFVFRSNVGKQELKVCQKITGLPFDGRQCLKAHKPLTYEAIPFDLDGADGSFKVIVTFYVKAPGSAGPYKQAARVALNFSS